MIPGGRSSGRAPRIRGRIAAIAFAMVLAVLMTASSRAAILFCRNGDRLEGEIVSESGTELVFETQNFGCVRVQRAAVVRIESGEVRTTVAPAPPPASAAPTPAVWKGRVALTIDRTRNAGPQDSLALNVRLQRDAPRDEVRLEANYDFRQDAQHRNADTLKTSTQWVHKTSERYFGTYRASTEWNRSFVYEGRDASYLLLQQEFGAGVSFAFTNGPRVRVGLAENLFNLWTRPSEYAASGNNQSVFAEIEWSLPWDTRLINRGVGFYSFKHHSAGVENTLELIRRISKTVSLSIKHDLREDVPDVRLQDHNNLRLMLGYDF